LPTQEAEIRRIVVQSQQIVHETLISKIPNTKIGMMEWLKVSALSSSPSTEKRKKKKLLRIGKNLITPGYGQ
jgi:hypothetical protein